MNGGQMQKVRFWQDTGGGEVGSGIGRTWPIQGSLVGGSDAPQNPLHLAMLPPSLPLGKL